MGFREKASEIECFVLDVDGVLTDGRLLCAPDGAIWRNMHARDGYALQVLLKKGYTLAIITSGRDHGVLKKLESYGVTLIYEDVWEKKGQLLRFAADKGVDPAKTLFIGDDVPDLPAMMLCGLRCCPADAAAEVWQVCDYVSPFRGGEGCVRDIAEQVLRIRGHWEIPV